MHQQQSVTPNRSKRKIARSAQVAAEAVVAEQANDALVEAAAEAVSVIVMTQISR
jgi:hypothetical protein